jgi:hypothetical protein
MLITNRVYDWTGVWKIREANVTMAEDFGNSRYWHMYVGQNERDDDERKSPDSTDDIAGPSNIHQVLYMYMYK